MDKRNQNREFPGNSEISNSANHPGAYTNPGILFREVPIDDEVLRYFLDQKPRYPDLIAEKDNQRKTKQSEGEEQVAKSESFSAIVECLEGLKGDRINIAFVHRFLDNKFEKTEYIGKYRTESIRRGVSEGDAENILNYVSPRRIGRRGDDIFSDDISFQKMHAIDALKWINNSSSSNRQVEPIIKKEYESYLAGANQQQRSPTAPPLLLIFLLHPFFKAGKTEAQTNRVPNLQYYDRTSEKEKFCDYPPTAYVFYHKDKHPISNIEPDLTPAPLKKKQRRG